MSNGDWGLGIGDYEDDYELAEKDKKLLKSAGLEDKVKKLLK